MSVIFINYSILICETTYINYMILYPVVPNLTNIIKFCATSLYDNLQVGHDTYVLTALSMWLRYCREDPLLALKRCMQHWPAAVLSVLLKHMQRETQPIAQPVTQSDTLYNWTPFVVSKHYIIITCFLKPIIL